MAHTIAAHCRTLGDMLPCGVHIDAVQSQKELDRLKNEVLGCIRFSASLPRVDGFVLLDESLVVHKFGVEARAAANPAWFEAMQSNTAPQAGQTSTSSSSSASLQ